MVTHDEVASDMDFDLHGGSAITHYNEINDQLCDIDGNDMNARDVLRNVIESISFHPFHRYNGEINSRTYN
jgi:hypothetical protein